MSYAERRQKPRSPTVALLLICGVALAASSPLSGAPSLAMGYRETLWGTAQGLPSSTVQAILQTRDGYLWVGTQEGLVRFDGAQFTVFDKSYIGGVTQFSVTALMQARDGTLWIGTQAAGLVSLRRGEFKAHTASSGPTDTSINAILEDWAISGSALTAVGSTGSRTAALPCTAPHRAWPEILPGPSTKTAAGICGLAPATMACSAFVMENLQLHGQRRADGQRCSVHLRGSPASPLDRHGTRPGPVKQHRVPELSGGTWPRGRCGDVPLRRCG
jgi:hypothetical protein